MHQPQAPPGLATIKRITESLIRFNAFRTGMEQAEVRTVVKVSLKRIAEEVAGKHSINLPFEEGRIDGDTIVFTFASGPHPQEEGPDAVSQGVATQPVLPSETDASPSQSEIAPSLPEARRTARVQKHRRHSSRNRMKTRGWAVVEKMANSHGQTVTIYKPFVDALRGVKLTRRQMERTVAGVLRENGNSPGRESVRYYLENTLEYLAKGKEQ